jgi:hypothetical protein
MKTSSKLFYPSLIITLFALRTIYGLMSEFWFEDELQIYLIGLKSFTTHSWPFYGPDVVYTNTQIPGALQGILVSGGLYLFPYPETPTIVLNILSFSSLMFFSFYISKRIKSIPKWLILTWLMTLTWAMDYGTRVVNPSYVLVFSIPFFVSLFELLPIYEKSILSRKLCFFILGLSPFLIMQLHLSYVLLIPFILLVFIADWRQAISLKSKLLNISLFFSGALVGILTLIPTWLFSHTEKSVSSNIVFTLDNFKNIGTILVRYLSFGSYEVPYILGATTNARLDVVKNNWWSAPFTIYLLLLGFFLVTAFLYVFIKNKAAGEWKKIKHLTLLGYGVTFFSFFFSIKGPASHTFYILFPLVVFYSFYCYEWLWLKYKYWKNVMVLAILSSLFFYTSLGMYRYKHNSLYKDREKVIKAIEMKDYKILGERRADRWGYGY